MLPQTYLTLRLLRLKSPEEWGVEGEGLVFLLLKGGAGKYTSSSLNCQLAPGDVLVLDTAPNGRLRITEGRELVFWSFSFCVEHLLPLFASDEISLMQEVMENFKQGRLYAASSGVARTCQRLLLDIASQFNLEHRSQLLRIIAVVLGVEFKQTHFRRAGFVRAEEHMTQVLENLSAADILECSVSSLARRFSCSRRHLNRLFHQHFGFSVAALKMEMRLLKAVALLRNPDAKIIHVAEQCGFNHLGLFNTCFKRRFGTSPGHWRKAPPSGDGDPLAHPPGTAVCQMHANGLCPWAAKPESFRPVRVQAEPTAARVPAGADGQQVTDAWHIFKQIPARLATRGLNLANDGP